MVAVLVRRTVAGRRFEAIGANPRAARAVGLRVRGHQASAYVYAQLLYCLAGVMLAGITAQPSAFEGDSFLLISVAVVVLGGTSLLGGRGYPLATVVAAVFLEQLVQFVVALGVSTAVQTIVQAVALAIGVSLYTVDWKALLRPAPRRARRPRPGLTAPSALSLSRRRDRSVVRTGRNVPMKLRRVLPGLAAAAVVRAHRLRLRQRRERRRRQRRRRSPTWPARRPGAAPRRSASPCSTASAATAGGW